MDKYLIVNAGSSSLKFSLYEAKGEREIISGNVEKIGLEDSFYTVKLNGEKIKKKVYCKNHGVAVKEMLQALFETGSIQSIDEIKGVGNRVLHGGEKYSDSVIITDEVIMDIEDLTKLGPLHHPGALDAIRGLQEFLPGVPMVAVYDTAFHQTIPEENYIYPVPMEWYEKHGVRKYGFHGTSHKYITEVMKERLNRDDVNLIICHVGSGASISAIKDGKCYDTTMGLTPLDGLMMGTRSGAIDASIIEYVCKESGKSIEEVMNDLNKHSGLIGISGKSDLRDVHALAQTGDKNAVLALTLYRNSIVKYITMYNAELDGEVDAIIFTAGAGENSPIMRKLVLEKLSKSMKSVIFDAELNENIASFRDYQEGNLSKGSLPVLVIPTNEEVMILRDTVRLIQKENSKKLVLK